MRFPELLLRHRVKIAIVLLCVAAGAWWIHVHQQDLSREALLEFGRKLPAAWLIVLFLLLPLAGFPISIFLVLVGIRFGFGGGMAISAAAVFFHNFAAHRLAHGLFRTRVRHALERAGYAIPPIKKEHRAWFTALFAAIHGPPYAVKLYLLALTDVPFRIYFWVGAPVYIAFCMIPVAVGSAVTQLNETWIHVIVGGLVILPLAGYWLRRRFAATATERF